MENCNLSGKSQGILKWMISGNPEFTVLTPLHSELPELYGVLATLSAISWLFFTFVLQCFTILYCLFSENRRVKPISHFLPLNLTSMYWPSYKGLYISAMLQIRRGKREQ